MANVLLAGNGFGGLIQGNFGNYQIGADGTFNVDARDAPALLTQGFAYVKQASKTTTLPLAPGVATVGGVVSSGALSNGVVAVTSQPDTMRPVNVEVGTGTLAITAGTVTVTYMGNDGQIGTDVISAVCALSSAVTHALSRGVMTISSIVVAGVTGGVSPWLRLSTTAAVSLPVDPGAVDFAVIREYDAGATAAIGTLSPVLGSILPTAAPNGTVTYSFAYNYISPVE